MFSWLLVLTCMAVAVRNEALKELRLLYIYNFPLQQFSTTVIVICCLHLCKSRLFRQTFFLLLFNLAVGVGQYNLLHLLAGHKSDY